MGRNAALDEFRRLCRQGRHEDAVVVLGDAIAVLQDQPGRDAERRRREYQDELGRLYLKLGRTEEASRLLEQAAAQLEAYNQDHELQWGCPYQALGVLYAEQARPDLAQSYMVKAAELEPDNPRTQFDAAVFLLMVGDASTALAYLERHRQAGASGASGPIQSVISEPELGVLEGYAMLLQRRIDEARSRFEGMQPSTAHPGKAVGLAHVALAEREYQRAAELLEPALAWGDARPVHEPVQDPDAAILPDPLRTVQDLVAELSWLGMAWLNANQGHHAESLPWYERILLAEPHHLLALMGKGTALTWLARYAEAEALFAAALERYPDNPYLLAELALVQLHLSRDEQAERTFLLALQHDDGSYTCPHEGLGMLYLRQGRLDEATRSFQRAIELNPDIEFQKYNGLAKIYIDQGRVAEARVLLEKSMANYPHHPEARDLLASIGGAPAASVER